MSADDSQKRVQRLVDDVRRELLAIADEQREGAPELAGRLAELANQLARAQGLTAAPLTSSYRHQVGMFQRWLRAEGERDEPPVATEIVLRYLQHRKSEIAPLTLQKDTMAIRRWHQATGHPDPTDSKAIQKLLS